MSDEEELEVTTWIEDGHVLHFRLDPGEAVISYVQCPNVNATALCNRGRDHCAVEMFVAMYKAEANIGSAVIDGPMEVAWTPILGDSDIDKEFSQIWVIPVKDPDYIADKLLRSVSPPSDD